MSTQSIHDAAREGDIARVTELLESDPALANQDDQHEWRPVFHAALCKHVGVVQTLIDRGADLFESYDVITDQGMRSGPISEKKLARQGDDLVYEDEALIYANQHRYVTIDNDKDETMVFKINHPVTPSPTDWSEWQKPDFILMDGMDKFTLLNGGEPKSKTLDVHVNTPTLRFKIMKK